LKVTEDLTFIIFFYHLPCEISRGFHTFSPPCILRRRGCFRDCRIP